jgi:hypothetical protein
LNSNKKKKTRININKVKTTFTARSPRHTKVGHPEGTKQKPGVNIRAAKGEGHVMCEMKLLQVLNVKIQIKNVSVKHIYKYYATTLCSEIISNLKLSYKCYEIQKNV